MFCDENIVKSHDISLLIETAVKHVPEFATCLAAGELPTPYSTLYRYPGVVNEPDRREIEEAVRAAEEIHAFVLSHLPKGYAGVE